MKLRKKLWFKCRGRVMSESRRGEQAKYPQASTTLRADPCSSELKPSLQINDDVHPYHTQPTMLLPRLQPPLRAALTSIARSTTGGTQVGCLNEAFAQLAIRARPVGGRCTGVRFASHKAQGAVNKAKDGPGKRLGAKKSGGLSSPFPSPLSQIIETRTGDRHRNSKLTSNRTIRDSRQHHLPPARHALVPRRQLRHGPRPYHLRHASRLCQILQRSREAP